MLIFLDTEFAESERGVALISVGLVDSAGRSFYAEMPEPHYRSQCNDWVCECVLPERTGPVVSRSDLDAELQDWIAPYDALTIVTDMPEHMGAQTVSDLMLLRRYAPGSHSRMTRSHPLIFTEESCGTQASVAMQGIRERSHQMSGYPRHHALGDAMGLRAMFRSAYYNAPELYHG